MTHNQSLNQIIKTPSIIGVHKPLVIAKEVAFKLPQGDKVCEPDVIMYDGKSWILVEYKCSGGMDNGSKAVEQLITAEEFIRDLGYKGDLRKVYVYGEEFNVEEIK